MNTSDGFTILLMFLICALVIMFGPFLSIWAVNTLFGLAIPYTLKTWFASLVLSGMISARGNSKG